MMQGWAALALVAALAWSAVPARAVPTSMVQERNPVRFVVGDEEQARVIFRSPPGDPFILTNFRDGTLSLSLLDRHLITFGALPQGNTSSAGSSAAGSGAPAAGSAEKGKEAEAKPAPAPAEQAPRFRQLLNKVPVRAAASGEALDRDLELSLLQTAEEPTSVELPGGDNNKKPVRVPHFAHMSNVEVTGTLSVRRNAPSVSGVPQWQLVSHDDFETVESRGRWFPQAFQSCDYPDMFLGGSCNFASEIPTRKFEHLPEHSFVRVEARYHFIDGWKGQFGYAKVDQSTVWTSSYDHCPIIWDMNCKVLSACGDQSVSDQLSTAVTAIVPHNGTSLELSFGSSLSGDPCDASFGVDDVKLFLL